MRVFLLQAYRGSDDSFRLSSHLAAAMPGEAQLAIALASREGLRWMCWG